MRTYCRSANRRATTFELGLALDEMATPDSVFQSRYEDIEAIWREQLVDDADQPIDLSKVMVFDDFVDSFGSEPPRWPFSREDGPFHLEDPMAESLDILDEFNEDWLYEESVL